MKQFTLATLAIAVSVAISTNAFALENEKQTSSSEKQIKTILFLSSLLQPPGLLLT